MVCLPLGLGSGGGESNLAFWGGGIVVLPTRKARASRAVAMGWLELVRIKSPAKMTGLLGGFLALRRGVSFYCNVPIGVASALSSADILRCLGKSGCKPMSRRELRD